MSFVKTNIPVKNVKPKTIEKWARSLRSIDTYIECDHSELANFPLKWATEEEVPKLLDHGKEFFNQLGTIGAGNHFCELQKIEEICDAEEFEKAGFDQEKVYMLVHSGSRGYGKHVLENFSNEYQKKGIKGFIPEMAEYSEYLEKHNDACNFARRNRALIAYRLMKELLGGKGPENLDNQEIDEENPSKWEEEEKFDIIEDLRILDDLE
jgi:RNA-splicing ligase RtcB